MHEFGRLSVEEFLGRLASAEPTPGGGTGAAVAGAMGAALVRMLASLTIGKPKYAAHEELMKAIEEEVAEQQRELLALASEDAASYDRVGAAYKLPRETDAQKATRTKAIQEAMKGACEAPLQVMERCTTVIGLAKNAVERGNRNAASDGAAGAELCRAAMKVASYNVLINLAQVDDPAWVKMTRTRVDEIAYMATAVATEIDSFVRDLWKK
jgi:formiminotetrahydrofolate cyclodeaminase